MKIKHYLMAALMLCMGMVACDGLENEVAEPTPKVFKAHFNLTGEISFEQEPMTRFTPDSKDLYAIQVYYKPVSGGSYGKYAYGLFDDVSNISLDLIENHYYMFEFVLVDDAKEKIYCDYILVDNQHYHGYGAPFKGINRYNASSEESITKVTNEFDYASDKGFSGFRYIHKAGGTEILKPVGIDAYYAEVVDYLPAADNEVISVYFKKMSFGLRIVAGDFLKEGTLSMRIQYSDANIKLTPENKVYEETFAYLDDRNFWYNGSDGWNASAAFSDIIWTKADGTQYKYKDFTAEYSRMKMTTVNIEFYEDGMFEGTSFDVKYEDVGFEEGYTYTHGNDQEDYVR